VPANDVVAYVDRLTPIKNQLPAYVPSVLLILATK